MLFNIQYVIHNIYILCIYIKITYRCIYTYDIFPCIGYQTIAQSSLCDTSTEEAAGVVKNYGFLV